MGRVTRRDDECRVLICGFLAPCIPGKIPIKISSDMYSMNRAVGRTKEYWFQTRAKGLKIDFAVTEVSKWSHGYTEFGF